MKIIDLKDEHKNLYFNCLEDWSDEMKESGDHKENWYAKMKDKDLKVKLALDDNGVVGGMIQYIPIEHSFVEGKDLYFIKCIWVHGYDKGRGNFQKKGMGKALLQSAEEDAKESGKKGIAAWGLWLPFWMKASWFKKQGYRPIDRYGVQVLLWKPFAKDVIPPKWIKRKKKPPAEKNKVIVSAFISGWCPAMNIVFERAKKASSEFRDRVDFRKIDTFDRQTFFEWGIADALFIDNKEIRTGPPPSYEKIKKIIEKRIKKIQ